MHISWSVLIWSFDIYRLDSHDQRDILRPEIYQFFFHQFSCCFDSNAKWSNWVGMAVAWNAMKNEFSFYERFAQSAPSHRHTSQSHFAPNIYILLALLRNNIFHFPNQNRRKMGNCTHNWCAQRGWISADDSMALTAVPWISFEMKLQNVNFSVALLFSVIRSHKFFTLKFLGTYGASELRVIAA